MAEKNKDDGRAFELKRAPQDDDDRREHATDRLSASGSSGAAEFDFLPAHLRRKYYVVEVDAQEARIYADRDGEYLVAKAGHGRLVTLVANVEIVRDLVAIAAHRGWERIELTGSLEFRREAWLAASARGIETKGYEPSELDRAALVKMQGRTEHRQQRSFERNREAAGAPARRSPSTERNSNSGADDRNARSHLAVIERIALAAFPKDAEARKRILDAARERMAHHRRRGARFDRAEIVEGKTKQSRESAKKSAGRTRDADRTERADRNR
ncbi:LPD7 domain-containing protein [Methylocystis sp.]|uniref:LPD7 domain-containing protein n=1 Tax=Methylocystis sp. TaxID=1911079 RepID=UPI0025F9FF5B|nr:LPD7 domain-containing protein [Methylocystis sp.]